MSSPRGGGIRGRAQAELKAANLAHRRHLARDINDVRTLADDREPIRRGNHWVWLAVAVVVFGVLALANGRGGTGDVPVTASCTTPAIVALPDPVQAGARLQYRLTGPDDVSYVVTLDGEPVQGDAGSTVRYTGTPAGPALQLTQCLSPSLSLAAPGPAGPHRLALLQLGADGTPTEVAALTLTVTSG